MTVFMHAKAALMSVSLVWSEVTSVLAWSQQSRWDNKLIFRWSARTCTAKTPATHRCSMESWTTAWWLSKHERYICNNKTERWLIKRGLIVSVLFREPARRTDRVRPAGRTWPTVSVTTGIWTWSCPAFTSDTSKPLLGSCRQVQDVSDSS